MMKDYLLYKLIPQARSMMGELPLPGHYRNLSQRQVQLAHLEPKPLQTMLEA